MGLWEAQAGVVTLLPGEQKSSTREQKGADTPPRAGKQGTGVNSWRGTQDTVSRDWVLRTGLGHELWPPRRLTWVRLHSVLPPLRLLTLPASVSASVKWGPWSSPR